MTKKEPIMKCIREWIQALVNIALLIVGIFAVCIYGRQLDVFRKQFAEMQSQTKILNGQVTQAAIDSVENSKKVERQLNLTQQQAQAATNSANESRKATELLRTSNKRAEVRWEAEHRPWVGNGEVGFKQPPVFLFYPDNPIGRTQISFTVDIPIKNAGISPAFHVETEFAGTMTEQIPAPDNMNTMMESACQWADRNSRTVGGILFPNTPEVRLERNANIGSPVAKIEDVHRVWIMICTAYSGDTRGEPLHHTRTWMASWPISGPPVEIRRNARPNIMYYSLPIPGWVVVKTEAD